jgi:uncharacterized membrane protein
MSSPIAQRIVNSQLWLDNIAEKVQPKVREIINRGGPTLRDALDGVRLGVPLHPVLTLDTVDLVSGPGTARKAADGALVVGVVGSFVAAAADLTDWRYLSGGSRRMGVAHALLNAAGLVLNTTSLVLRATGRSNAGRLALLIGFTLNGVGVRLGGELTYRHGLRDNRAAFERSGPDEFSLSGPLSSSSS